MFWTLFQWKEEKIFVLEKVGDELDPVSYSFEYSVRGR